jgi:hypothetical protein
MSLLSNSRVRDSCDFRGRSRGEQTLRSVRLGLHPRLLGRLSSSVRHHVSPWECRSRQERGDQPGARTEPRLLIGTLHEGQCEFPVRAAVRSLGCEADPKYRLQHFGSGHSTALRGRTTGASSMILDRAAQTLTNLPGAIDHASDGERPATNSTRQRAASGNPISSTDAEAWLYGRSRPS